MRGESDLYGMSVVVVASKIVLHVSNVSGSFSVKGSGVLNRSLCRRKLRFSRSLKQGMIHITTVPGTVGVGSNDVTVWSLWSGVPLVW